MSRLKNISFFQWMVSKLIDRLATGTAIMFERFGSGSFLLRYKAWASNAKVQQIAWVLLGLGFIGFMATKATTIIPSSFALLYELLVYVCFSTIVIHKREWGLAIFAFHLPFLTYRPLLVLLLLLVLFLFVNGPSKEKLREVLGNKLNIGVLFFMLVMLLSSIASAGWEKSVTNYGLYFLTSLLLYFLILLYVDSKRALKLVLIGLIAGGLFISVFAAYQYAVIDFTDPKWVDTKSNPLLTKRVAATFENPNLFAQYLVLVAPIAFVLMWLSTTWRSRIYSFGMFMLIVLALVLTFSRGSWAALFVAGVLLAMMLNRRLVLLGIIIGAIGINFLPDVIMDRVLSMFNTDDSSASYRFDAWNSAIAMIRDYWLTGIGMDERTFLRVYPDYMVNDVRVFHFHNIYLHHFVTGGILGIGAVLFLFYQGFRNLVQQIFSFRGKDAFLSGIAKGLFASLVAIVIAGLSDDIWRHYAVNFTFWLVFALIGVLYQFSRREVLENEG